MYADQPTLTLTPIGVINTPYTERYTAPRQPGAATVGVDGIITLFPHLNFEQALEDLVGFDRIWVIYWFHRNTGWKPKVLPPRGGLRRRGVFATRSPHRPNPLGLSLLELHEVRGRTLRVGNVDLLDGTPILDIKPYLPYAEAFPDAAIGWLEDVEAAERETGAAPFAVVWSELAREQASWLHERFGIDLASVALPLLTRQPFPHPYRRITRQGDGFELAIRSWRLRFHGEGMTVVIDRIESGYSQEVVALADPAEPLHDGAAHEDFHRRWPAR